MELTVLNRQRSRRVSARALRGFLGRLTRRIPTDADSLTLCLVSRAAMTRLNERFRGKSGATDVLSFGDDRAPDPDGLRHLGDIVIAVPVAAAQARAHAHSLARELRLLTLHGYLHLLGYDHETDGGTMMRLQRRLARELLPRPAKESAG